ncbi:MAG: group 1 glycosyl transferase, partial [Nitrospiraceae bacterium]
SDLIIFNSWAGQQHHIAHGYCGKRMAVVPNGINTERFRPDAESRQRVRTEWVITEDQVLIGLVARLDPMKDHPTFLRAAARVAVLRPNVRFVCVGDGPQTYKRELWSLSEALQLKERLIWAGSRTDIVAVYNALDIAVLSSYGEGFPNVVAEAMACGVPCVVTNVGAAAQIVGPMGVVVQPRDPEALCQGMLTSLCRLTEPGLSQQVRERIVQTFSRERLVCATKELLESLL